MTELLPSELAWYVTGRFYATATATVSIADYGYFLHLAGIVAPLFNGPVAEMSAHFMFAAKPFVAVGVSNGALSLSLDPVGEFSVFLQRMPAANFDDPASFSRGERIATFRRVSMVVGTTVDTGTTQLQGLISSNVFSARLIDSVPFEFGGVRYHLRQMLGAGITQFGTAATTAINPPLAGYSAVVPFTGSAIKLGG